MKTDGEAVLQTLTAVWRGMRHLRGCGERGNDLEEVEQLSGTGLGTVRPPSGSSSFGVDCRRWRISRHTAVISCGTVSPSCLPMWKCRYSPFPMSDIEFSKSDVVFSMSVIEFPMSDQYCPK